MTKKQTAMKPMMDSKKMPMKSMMTKAEMNKNMGNKSKKGSK
jgi:hypothetical protein